ncbi:MAG: alpha/beta hydrolase [Chloroflexota bacterium]|nr:alpha/beta hydrolase [Chloroflexota bacterium]
MMKQKVGCEGVPTAKALEYATLAQAEIALPHTNTQRRANLQEDLSKLEQAHFVKINGVNHFYLDEGPPKGESVILLHGWDCSSFWWHSIVDILNIAGFRTINYDLRGHGFTDDPIVADYEIATLVDDLRKLAELLQLEKFHLLSFSVGSLIATAYAARYPESVASVAFFNYGLFKYSAAFEQFGAKALATVFSKVLRRLKSWRAVYYYARLTLLKNPASRRDIEYGLLSLRDTSPNAAFYMAKSTMSREVLDQLPQWVVSLKMPTLLVAGSHDKVISQKSSKRLATLLPNCTYFVMPHCGHLILAELPAQVATLLKLHLTRASINLTTMITNDSSNGKSESLEFGLENALKS